ncbi:hypothetical protein BDN70DRAFT_883874 [Pholiota conissans]|uniref:Uncharacterized protein n=1 Tax=Pholiota conissans TaxID=109636 RepID=A0A9P6CX69_9AGAR|nr:hypothetical protein BDN70DRAFT_883874 [Pholiota conissans]
MRQASLSRDARPETGPDDFSVTRGREAIISPTNVYSTGRGGAGNLHSPSRDGSRVRPTPDAAEQEVIRDYVAAHENVPFSSGRGGIGNIARSRSRDPNSDARTATSPVRHTTTHISHTVHSTGRGGAGNIYPGDGISADVIDEQARRGVSQERGRDAFHSTGRGGFANLSSAAEPAVEHHSVEHGGYESTGRGGLGNIVHDTGKERSD